MNSKVFGGFKVDLIEDVSNEGPVTQVWNAFGLVVFATANEIRVMHFKRKRQKICKVAFDPNTPDIYVP